MKIKITHKGIKCKNSVKTKLTKTPVKNWKNMLMMTSIIHF